MTQHVDTMDVRTAAAAAAAAAPPSLLSQLPPDEREERESAIRQYITSLQSAGPKETFPWASYVSLSSQDSFQLVVDPDRAAVPLTHVPWIPLPMHLIQDNMRPYMSSLATRIMAGIAAQQHFVCVPLFTPSLLMLLSTRPGIRAIEQLRDDEQIITDAYTQWEAVNRHDPNRHTSTEALHAVRSIMEIRGQRARLIRERLQFEEPASRPRYMASTAILGQYLRAKHLVIATCGFTAGIDTTSEGKQFHEHVKQAEKILDAKLRAIVEEFYAANEPMDRLVAQVARYGQIDDLGSHVEQEQMEQRLIKYTVDVIRAVESWFLAAANITDERLHHYHQSAYTIPRQKDVPQALMRECISGQARLMQQREREQPYLWRCHAPHRARTVRHETAKSLMPLTCGKSVLAAYAYATATTRATHKYAQAYRTALTRHCQVMNCVVDLSNTDPYRVLLPAETPTDHSRVLYSCGDAA